MLPRIQFVLFILLISCPALFAQKGKKADKLLLDNLETHIHYLSDPKLEGRKAGAPGEKVASDYISIEFMKAGLQSKGDNNGWLQAFEIDEGKQIDPDAWFSVNDKAFILHKEYFPLAFSPAVTVSGAPAIALQERGDPWFIDLKDMVEAGHNTPHFDLNEAIHTRVKESAKKGATAIILYNTSKIADNLAFDPKDRTEKSPIPVLYITKEAKRKYLKDESASLEMKIKVAFTERKRTGHNVLGWIDNGAPVTVIIGAHYNGADDHTGGVAGTIELAKMLKQSRFKNNNYLFIAFSGEEPGLFGSVHFVDHPAIDLKKVNYMINLDPAGNPNDSSSHTLTIGGYGSSPAWSEACGGSVNKKYFTLSYDSSGTGTGDQTAFYRKDIPVLLFSTGLNKDDYTGEAELLRAVYNLVGAVNGKGRIAFTKIR